MRESGAHGRKRTKLVMASAVAVVLLASCAFGVESQLSYAASSDEAATELKDYIWSSEDDCTTCHQKEAKTLEKEKCLVSKHATQLECVDCHYDTDAMTQADSQLADDKSTSVGDEDGTVVSVGDEVVLETLETVHEDVTSTEDPKKGRLWNTAVDDAVCLACHDTDDLVEATKDCDVLTDADGTVINPHDVPESDQHATLTCVSCHGMHTNEDAWASYRACVSCHHAEIWECGTCHTYVKDEG